MPGDPKPWFRLGSLHPLCGLPPCQEHQVLIHSFRLKKERNNNCIALFRSLPLPKLGLNNSCWNAGEYQSMFWDVSRGEIFVFCGRKQNILTNIFEYIVMLVNRKDAFSSQKNLVGNPFYTSQEINFFSLGKSFFSLSRK